MKKLLALVLSFAMLSTLIEIFPVAALSPTETIMLDMNFESAATGNLLNTMTTADSTGKLFSTDIDNVMISYSAGGLEAAKTRGYVGVYDITGERNTALNDGKHTNVFKYQHNTAADTSNFLMVKIKPESTEELINSVNNHIIVVEMDMYFEPHKGQSAILSPTTTPGDYVGNYLSTSTNMFLLSSRKTITCNAEKYYADISGDAYKEQGNIQYRGFNTAELAGNWHRIKYVFDATDKTGTLAKDTFRMYIDDEIVSTTFDGTDIMVYDFICRAKENFLDTFAGLCMGGKASTLNGAQYYDNIKVTKIDKDFAIESSTLCDGDANIEVDSEFVFTFTTPIDIETINNIHLKDQSGNKVDGALNIEVDQTDDSKLNIKLNSAVVSQFTPYSLVFPGTFTDKYGQGLESFYLYNIDRAEYSSYENVPLTADVEYSFTTAQIVEATATPAFIENYDIGQTAEIEFDFGQEIVVYGDISDAFSVKDKNNKNITGLTGTVSTDSTKITVSLDKLALGDGTHYITIIPGSIKTKDGQRVYASATIDTVDFNVNVDTTEVTEYIFGTPQNFTITSNIALSDTDLSKSFDVTDADGTEVSGLEVTKEGNVVSLDISKLQFGRGTHVIKPNEKFTDLRGRTANFLITVVPVEVKVTYENSVTEYQKGTDKKINISLSQPLSDVSVDNIANSFKVKNDYGMNVSGLGVSVSTDKMSIELQLKDLDISGGTYEIIAEDGEITAANRESFGAIMIALSTSISNEPSIDSGVSPDSGSSNIPTLQGTMLIEENFENYEKNIEWLDTVPEKWRIVKNNSASFADDSVMVVTDPTGKNNQVLMVSAGHNDADGNVVSDGTMSNTVIRDPDLVASTELFTDSNTIISIKTDIYIPTEHYGNFPIWAGSADEQKGYEIGNRGSFINALGNGDALAIPAHVSRVNSTRAAKSVSMLYQTCPFDDNLMTPVTPDNDHRLQVSNDAWHTLEFVFKTINGKKYYQFIYDGTLYSGDCDKAYTNWTATNNLTNFNGMMTKIVSNAVEGSSPVVYYDNWEAKVYYPLDTHIDVAKVDVEPKRDIILTFRNKLTDDSFEAINKAVKIKDEFGREAAISIVKLSDASIKIDPVSELRYKTRYTVTVDNADGKIVDVFGQTLKDVTYNFETAKSHGTAIDAASGVVSYIGDIKTATNIEYTMKLTQNADVNYIGVVAIYSNNGTLISMEERSISVGNDSAEFTLSAPNGGVDCIKMFLYEETSGNLFAKMTQRPDEITAR